MHLEVEKTLTDTKISLNSVTKQNHELEIKVKNLLEELKLTKGAAGDSGKEFKELQLKFKKLEEEKKKLNQILTDKDHQHE